MSLALSDQVTLVQDTAQHNVHSERVREVVWVLDSDLLQFFIVGYRDDLGLKRQEESNHIPRLLVPGAMRNTSFFSD